jgi:hypothetical protein
VPGGSTGNAYRPEGLTVSCRLPGVWVAASRECRVAPGPPQGRYLLHSLAAGGATAVCLLGETLLSGGGEGGVQVRGPLPAEGDVKGEASHQGTRI